MRALLYLLTLTFGCFLKNVNCVTFKDFKKNAAAMFLAGQYHNDEIKTQTDLNQRLNNIGVKLNLPTLSSYLEIIRAEGGGYRKSAFEQFKENRDAMALVALYNNKQNTEIITKKKLLKRLEDIGVKMDKKTLTKYLNDIEEEAQQNPAPQIAQQSSNFTSGNPGSSTSASNKGKSTNISKGSNTANWPLSSITGSASHYGGAMPSQQAPPTDVVPSQAGNDSWDWLGGNSQNDDGSLQSMVNPKKPRSSHYGGAMPSQQAPPTDVVPSQAGNDSWDWLGGNSQNDEGSLQSMVNPKNPSSLKNAWGFVSNLFGASPQEPQFLPPMHDTSAASSYYPSNNQTLELVITPRNQKGFGGTPFLPNQSQSTGRTSASNFFSPTLNASNFTSGNRGSSSHYGGAIPFQQAPPMHGTSSFPAFQNQPFRGSSSHYGGAIPFQQAPMSGTSSFPAFPTPFNQSAQLNPSTNFGPPQTEKDSWDWSGVNSQNNAGTLESMINTRKPSSSKGTNETKTGKKPRK